MSRHGSNMDKRRKKAIESGDLNRILWVCYPSAARALFYNGLNGYSAAANSSPDPLLALPGIGPAVIKALREAMKLRKR